MNDTAPYDAHCHCGAVRIRIAAKPEYMNDCNCSLCRKTGAVWGYYDPAEVSIDGKTKSYTRADKPDPAVNLHFCGHCGVTTHWTLTESFVEKNPDANGSISSESGNRFRDSEMRPTNNSRMGVNMRLFGDEAKAGVELRFPDGKGWDGKGDWGFYREAEVYGAQNTVVLSLSKYASQSGV